MISSVKVTSGFAADLPALKDRTIEFTEGVNILFGANGCGKSSLLRIMAAYNMIPCDTGGWSRLARPRDLRSGAVSSTETFELPHAFAALGPGHGACRADVVWNGRPTFIYDTARIETRGKGYFIEDERDSPDGLTDMREQLGVQLSNISQGELNSRKFMMMWERLGKWRDAEDALHNPPRVLSHEKELIEQQIAYLESLKRLGRCTVLLDEPDRSLSIETQVIFWMVLVQNLAKSMQVIVASHNPLLLMNNLNANIINMGQYGYVDNARDLLTQYSSGKLTEEALKAIVASMTPVPNRPDSKSGSGSISPARSRLKTNKKIKTNKK